MPAVALAEARHRVQRLLSASGFSQVHDISEGMLGGEYGPGWLARSLPTEPCTDC
jgi:hypothetical protein